VTGSSRSKPAIAAAGTGQRAAPAHRGAALAALMLAVGPALMDSTVIATSLPRIVSDLGGFPYSSWLFSGYLLAAAVTMPVYGSIADFRGRKPVLASGMLLFLLGSLVCALAWNMASLIAFRVLQGMGAGAIHGTAQTLAGDLYEPEERARAQAGFSAVGMSASLAGPVVGGLLSMYTSWRWIFVINLPILGVALLLMFRNIRDPKAPGMRSGHRIDWAGALGLFASAGLLLFFLVQGGVAWPWFSAPSALTLCGTALCAAATVWIERRAASPIIPPWVWRRRVLVAGNIALGAFGLVVTAPALILPIYAQSVLGLNPVTAGLVLATVIVSWPAAAVFSNHAYLRLGFRDTALAGSGVATVALLAVVLLPYQPPIWSLLPLLLLLGAALGFYQPPIVVGVQSTVVWEERATATSSILFCRQTGQSAGAALFGAIANAVLVSRLAATPPGLKSELPPTLDRISSALGDRSLSPQAADYLRHAISAVADWDLAVAAGAGAVAFLALLLIAPRRFPRAVPPAFSSDPRVSHPARLSRS
jgi:MFS family permease